MTFVVLLTFLELFKEVLKVVAGPLFAVLIGGYFLQKFFASRSNEAEYIDFLEERLADLRKEAFAYWKLPQGSIKADAQAQRLKGDILSLYCDVLYYTKRYYPKEECLFGEALFKITDACTGGDFESTNRNPEPGRYLTITTAINELKSMLFQRKM